MLVIVPLLAICKLFVASYSYEQVDQNNSDCSNIDLKERNYCSIPKKDYNCYVDQAIQYSFVNRRKTRHGFRDLCIFKLHKQYSLITEKDGLNCPVISRGGSNFINCQNSSSFGEMKFNCTHVFVWENGTLARRRKFSDIQQLFYDGGDCQHLTVVQEAKRPESSEILFVSERYVYDLKSKFPSCPCEWIKLDLYEETNLVVVLFVLLPSVLFLVLLFLAWNVSRRKIKEFKLELEHDVQLKNLERVLSVSEAVYENNPTPEIFYDVRKEDEQAI